MSRGKNFANHRVLARATAPGEKWSVELVFDEADVEAAAEAAKAGKRHSERGSCSYGVASRSGRGGWPRISWFRDPTEAVDCYQDEVDRFSGKKDERREEENEDDEWW